MGSFPDTYNDPIFPYFITLAVCCLLQVVVGGRWLVTHGFILKMTIVASALAVGVQWIETRSG